MAPAVEVDVSNPFLATADSQELDETVRGEGGFGSTGGFGGVAAVEVAAPAPQQ